MKNKLMSDFIECLLKAEDPKDLEAFLRAILTPSELEEIPKRLAIIRLLKQGVPQREIGRRLGVGIATVTRGVRELRMGHFKDI